MTREKTISRALAEADGLSPDALVSRMTPYTTNRGVLVCNEYQCAPAWQLYRGDARTVMDALGMPTGILEDVA